MQKIDFELEVKELIDNKLVKSIEVLQKKVEYCKMKFTTLENFALIIECSAQNGINVRLLLLHSEPALPMSHRPRLS